MIIYKNVIYVILTILLVFITFNLVTISNNIAIYLKTKDDDLKLRRKSYGYITFADKAKATSAIVDLINMLVDQEVKVFFNTFIHLGQVYNIQNLDDDIQKISKKVYAALKSDLYSNTEILLDDEYIMTYIIDETTIVFLAFVKELNTLARKV